MLGLGGVSMLSGGGRDILSYEARRVYLTRFANGLRIRAMAASFPSLQVLTFRVTIKTKEQVDLIRWASKRRERCYVRKMLWRTARDFQNGAHR